MALTRKFLKGLGVTDDQIDAIIEAHAETVDGLKADRDRFKTDAEKLAAVSAELETLKANQGAGNEWEQRYNDEHAAFEDFKASQAAEAVKGKKRAAFEALAKAAGVGDKYLAAVIRASGSEIEALEIDDNGVATNGDAVSETIKSNWSDFISVKTPAGAHVPTPPAGSGKAYTPADIKAMTPAEINANWAAIKESLKG